MVESNLEVATTSPPPDFSQADQEALIGRVVASSHFRRASRLRDFLLFVGQRAMQKGHTPIHEQEIGAAVFERPEVYDTSVDNIVRVNATELRKRLELYFSTEGAHEPVVIEMARGSYTLQFRQRPIVVEPFEPPPPPSPESTTHRPKHQDVTQAVAAGRSQPAGWLSPAIAIFFLLASAFLLWQNVRLQHDLSPWRSGSALRSFWSEFLGNGQEVDVVLADTSFALAEDMEGRSIPLTSYLNYDYKRFDNLPTLSADKRDDIQIALDRNNGSVGDYIVAQRIIALDHATNALKLKFAREYSSEAIKTNSVVLIGSRQSNPWVELFGNRMNFSMDYDPVHHQSSIRNRQPRQGEESVYIRSGGTSRNEGLSLISFMPDLSGTGSALIIQGTDSQATRAAGEFVTNDTTLADFLQRIKATRFPYFEILLKNSQLTGTPLRSQILAYRIYPRTGEATGPEALPTPTSDQKPQ